jgi:thymidylate synthase
VRQRTRFALMEILASTLDDLMYDVLTELLGQSLNIPVSKGKLVGELNGVVLRLTNPRARISRTETRGKTISALGELLWYLSKKNDLDFISYYIASYSKSSDDGKSVHGGYGPRLFNLDNKYNQFENIVEVLTKKPNSRQAVIQIFKAEDIIVEHKDVPCTCVLQFIIRNNNLNMVVYMRSNDVFLGLPHDVFCFTMLQEILACTLKVQLGEYVHMVGNLHLYEAHKAKAQKYIKEGIQSSKIQMPIMPNVDIDSSIQKILVLEEKLRKNELVNINDFSLDEYWLDIARLLQSCSRECIALLRLHQA